MAQQFHSDIAINGQMAFGSKQAYTLPAQGTRMRLLQIADNTLCRVYLDTGENNYHQPIILDIFYRAQFTTSKPQIVRSESYEWHAHSNDVIFTSDQAGTAGADSYIYAEKVAYSTGRPLNIRKIEVFDGTVTVLDGSTTDTNGGTDETIVSTFAEVNLGDNDYLRIGDGNDLQLVHDASNSHIINYVGDLKITNNANDKDVIFNCDDGSGGNTAYITLDGSATAIKIGKELQINGDSRKLKLGAGGDLEIFHNGTDSSINNATGDLYIKNEADDKDIIFQSDNGSGGTATYFFLDGSATQTTFQYNTRHNDSVEARFGDSSDLRISHDGTDSIIRNYVGDLKIINSQDDGDIKFQSDDGSGGLDTYFTLDGGLGYTTVQKDIRFNDSVDIKLGTGNDCTIMHDSTDTWIDNATGDLKIRNQTDNGDILFYNDDGSGGVTEYFRLDGGDADGTLTYTKWADNSIVTLGASKDLRIYHNGTNSIIQNYTGNLSIRNGANDGDIIFDCDDHSGGLSTYFFLDGSDTSSELTTTFPDNSKAAFGTGNDLRLWHDGSTSYINNYTGDFRLYQHVDDGDMIFYCDDGSGGATAYITLDGSAETVEVSKITNFSQNIVFASQKGVRFNDSNTRIYTNAETPEDLIIEADQDLLLTPDGGVNVTAALTVGVDDTGHDVKFYGATTSRFLHWDESEDYLLFRDNVKGVFGNGADLKLYHDASNSYIENGTGNIYIMARATDADISFQSDDGSGGDAEYLRIDGGDEQVKVFKNLTLDDNIQAWFGNSNDLRIYHDGSDSYIEQAGNGSLVIYNSNNDADIRLRCDDGSGGVATYLTLDGSEEKVIVNKPSQRTFEVSDASTHGDANGDIVYFGGTTSMSAGKIYHYKANGTWELADADAASTSDGLLAVAIGAASDTNGMLLRGMVTLDHDPGDLGDVLFLSTTAGEATGTAPSGSGDIVRVVGYLLGGAHGQIYFNPDGAFVEVA